MSLLYLLIVNPTGIVSNPISCTYNVVDVPLDFSPEDTVAK